MSGNASSSLQQAQADQMQGETYDDIYAREPGEIAKDEDLTPNSAISTQQTIPPSSVNFFGHSARRLRLEALVDEF